MKNIKITFILLFLFQILATAQAQFDTLTVMQYNLMRYGAPSLGINCSPPTYTIRANYMKTIIGFVLPDVLAVEEMQQGTSAYAQYLLANALNQNGRTYYKRASYNTESGDDITDILYYNGDVLTLTSQFTIGCSPRSVHGYTLLYSNPANNTDTVSLTFLVAHFKAGTTNPASANAPDAVARGTCANNVMKYMKQNMSTTGNYFLMGDFNLYMSSEPAWQNITNTTLPSAIRFFDPINQVGTWTNNATYAAYHTQSTRLNAPANDCFSTGGMDDRFDFILTTNNVLPAGNATNKVKYIPTSYKAVGNDGQRFNGDVYDAANPNANGSVSGEVAQALYNMSDHIPVRLKLQIKLQNATTTGIALAEQEAKVLFTNPATTNQLIFHFNQTLHLTILDAIGTVKMKDLEVSQQKSVDISALNNGIYVLVFSDKSGQKLVKKLIINKE